MRPRGGLLPRQAELIPRKLFPVGEEQKEQKVIKMEEMLIEEIEPVVAPRVTTGYEFLNEGYWDMYLKGWVY